MYSVTIGLQTDARGEAAGMQLGANQFRINTSLHPRDGGISTRQTSGDDADDDDGAATNITSLGPARRRFVVTGASRDEKVRLDANGMHLDGENVTLDRLDLTGVPSGDLELDAAGAIDPTELDGMRALDAPTTPRSIGYLSLAYDVAPDDIDSTTLRFSADADYLNATGTDPEDVTLYGETDAGDWEEVSVEIVGEEAVDLRELPEDRVHFRATTDADSSFAVAKRTPRFDVADVTPEEEPIEAGDTASVTATITNGGGVEGNRTVALTADGEVVANEPVALGPNETTTVAFDVAFDTARAYDLAVDGTPVGSLLVVDPEVDGSGNPDTAAGASDRLSTADGSADASLEEPSAIDLSELGGLVSLLAIVAVTVVLVRRKSGS